MLLRDLGDGLVLRRAREDDVEALAAFNAGIFHREGSDEPNPTIATWTRDLALRPPPGMGVGNFYLVEDRSAGLIVAAACLIPQTWAYEDVSFPAGQIELVGTRPGYRNRGLVRALIAAIHQESEARGQRLLAIDGINYFYRQFGYEYALAQQDGVLGCYHALPRPEDVKDAPFSLREAREEDLPYIAGLWQAAMRRYLVTSVRGEAEWRYELQGRSAGAMRAQRLQVIIRAATGERVGLLTHGTRLAPWMGRTLFVTMYEMEPGVSWAAVTPVVLAGLRALGEELAAAAGLEEPWNVSFWLGEEHPSYQVLPEALLNRRSANSWYVRVPDLPRFLELLAPVLERRLANSVMAGHSGELRLSFYRDGLWLKFKGGRLAGARPWSPTPEEQGDAGFPGLTFLQLLFGYRTLAEIEYAFPDCRVTNERQRPLILALFPRRASCVWPVV